MVAPCSPPPFSKFPATPSACGTHIHSHTGRDIGEDEQPSRRDTDVIMRVWVYVVSTLNDGDDDDDEDERKKGRKEENVLLAYKYQWKKMI